LQVGYFARLQRLIEEAVADRGEPCIIIAHSMGGLVGHYFLTKVPSYVPILTAAAVRTVAEPY
jgi:alpha-beta hydrolase superfamily lysophospholipase